MKWVRVEIRPSHLDDVIAALGVVGLTRMTVTEVQAWDERTRDAYDDEEDELRADRPQFVPHAQIELAVRDEDLRLVLEAVRRSAAAGPSGHGHVFVAKLVGAARIRTAERGDAAL
jgi:nitrogen regulatory protein PII